MADSDDDKKKDPKESIDPFAGMGERAKKAADAMIAEQQAKLEEQKNNS